MSDELPSKSQRKRDMHELQTLGAELVELNDDQLAAVDLPELLLDAVQAARGITKHEARRRQLQYIGKIMRHVDPEPIRAQIAAWQAVSAAHTARLHLVERWRDRLLQEEDAVTQLANEYPGVDIPQVRLLIRNAARERASEQPPKSYRALFKLLNALIGNARES